VHIQCPVITQVLSLYNALGDTQAGRTVCHAMGSLKTEFRTEVDV